MEEAVIPIPKEDRASAHSAFTVSPLPHPPAARDILGTRTAVPVKLHHRMRLHAVDCKRFPLPDKPRPVLLRAAVRHSIPAVPRRDYPEVAELIIKNQHLDL